MESGKLYLLDRGFGSYQLLGDIVAADSDFLVRARRGSRFEVLKPRPLSAADLRAGVPSDARVQISGWRARGLGDVPLRLVEIALETGARPSSYDYSMMSMVAAGLVTSASARTILARRRAERTRAAA